MAGFEVLPACPGVEYGPNCVVAHRRSEAMDCELDRVGGGEAGAIAYPVRQRILVGVIKANFEL